MVARGTVHALPMAACAIRDGEMETTREAPATHASVPLLQPGSQHRQGRTMLMASPNALDGVSVIELPVIACAFQAMKEVRVAAPAVPMTVVATAPASTCENCATILAIASSGLVTNQRGISTTSNFRYFGMLPRQEAVCATPSGQVSIAEPVCARAQTSRISMHSISYRRHRP